VRIFATEVVQEAVLCPHELDINFRILMPTGPTGIDQELDINTFLVHVMDASINVPVVTVQPWILTPHELAVGTACCGTRLRFAQRARDICAPAADGATAPEVKAPRVGWRVCKTSRMPLVGDFATLQVRH
jgi:hypothetical protein